MYFTGSKEHNIILRERAIKQKKRLNEYGLFDAEENCLESKTETAIYKNLGLPYIPPEIRKGKDELSLTKSPQLIQLSDIKSDLHCHTVASDGNLSIKELAEEAMRHGLAHHRSHRP